MSRAPGSSALAGWYTNGLPRSSKHLGRRALRLPPMGVDLSFFFFSQDVGDKRAAERLKLKRKCPLHTTQNATKREYYSQPSPVST